MELNDEQLKAIAEDSAFIHELTDAYLEKIGGQLTAETMALLNVNQHTLLAYRIILDEVMEGGFIQLIQNGWGPYIFNNPFAKVLRSWGERDLAKLIFEAGNYYRKHVDELEAELSEEEFMALFEDHEELNDLGDDFLDLQEVCTPSIAKYVREHEAEF